MSPSQGIDQMIRVAAERITDALNNIESTANARPIDLWLWVRHKITIITTDSVYGPLNPYRNPEVENAFWDFADHGIMLLAGVLPSILAPTAFRGREKVVRAMERLFDAQGHQNGSSLIQARWKILKQEIDLRDIARFECVNGIALLVNTVPAAFWTIYHVFSNPKALNIIQAQGDRMCKVKKEDGATSQTIDLEMVKNTVVLKSVVHEALRHRGSGTGPRMVTKDTILDNRYLLQKGFYLIIPQHELHFNKSAWSENYQEFDPSRFARPDSKKIDTGAFRSWGGGANVCPGKGFATTEIITLVIMLARRYHIEPVSGQWTDPRQDLTNISLAISPPKAKVLVKVEAKERKRPHSWCFSL